MKKLLLIIYFSLMFHTLAYAEVKELVYDGKEIYLHVKKDHLTTVIFPEPINGVIRGFGADSYVVQRNDRKPNTLEFMPTDLEAAEMTISGVSGENYVLRFIRKDDFYTKLTILAMAAALDKTDLLNENLLSSEKIHKNEEKAIVAKKDVLPDHILEKNGQKNSQSNQPKSVGVTNTSSGVTLPIQLNLKVTLKGNDLPLHIYLDTISKATGYNIIATPDVKALKASVSLEDIEVWRALKSLLYPFGYGFKVSKEDLIISTVETRIFEVAIPAVDQSFSDITSNESSTNNETVSNSSNSTSQQQGQDINIGTKITLENKSPALSLWNDLENNIKTMITPKTGSYSLNKVSGSIVVTDTPGVLDKIDDLIATINKSLRKQESFEIQIIEVTLSSDYEMGIDWSALARNINGLANLTGTTNFSNVGFTGGQLLSLAATGPDSSSGTTKNGVSLILKALDQMGRVEVISRPSITVTNMIPCIIQEGTSTTYISNSGQIFNTNTTSTTVGTSQVSDGLTMRLVAKIGDTDTVLNISAAVTTLDALNSVQTGGVTIQTPTVSNKSITTNVGVEEGKSLIIGGLISSTKNNNSEGVPGLSKIPLFGNAFKYQQRTSNKSELVIIITPKKVINNI